MSLAQPFKAGIRQQPSIFVASATVEKVQSLPRDACRRYASKQPVRMENVDGFLTATSGLRSQPLVKIEVTASMGGKT
jgi:hypothetical protein